MGQRRRISDVVHCHVGWPGQCNRSVPMEFSHFSFDHHFIVDLISILGMAFPIQGIGKWWRRFPVPVHRRIVADWTANVLFGDDFGSIQQQKQHQSVQYIADIPWCRLRPICCNLFGVHILCIDYGARRSISIRFIPMAVAMDELP